MPVINTTRAYKDAGGTVGNTVVAIDSFDFATEGLTSAQNVERAQRCWLTCTTNGVLYRYTGLDPASGSSHYLAPGDEIEIIGQHNISNLKFIRASGSDATIWITLEK